MIGGYYPGERLVGQIAGDQQPTMVGHYPYLLPPSIEQRNDRARCQRDLLVQMDDHVQTAIMTALVDRPHFNPATGVIGHWCLARGEDGHTAQLQECAQFVA